MVQQSSSIRWFVSHSSKDLLKGFHSTRSRQLEMVGIAGIGRIPHQNRSTVLLGRVPIRGSTRWLLHRR